MNRYRIAIYELPKVIELMATTKEEAEIKALDILGMEKEDAEKIKTLKIKK